MVDVLGNKIEQYFVPDSGYSTAQESLESKLGNEDLNTCPLTPNLMQLKPSTLAPVQEGQTFAKEVDDAIVLRFNEIRAQIEVLLLKYIRKGRGIYRPLAIRLKILKEDSTPYIIIFYPENKCDCI